MPEGIGYAKQRPGSGRTPSKQERRGTGRKLKQAIKAEGQSGGLLDRMAAGQSKQERRQQRRAFKQSRRAAVAQSGQKRRKNKKQGSVPPARTAATRAAAYKRAVRDEWGF